MSLIVLEGLDRSGKSSVAEHFKSQGYQIIHQSAPAKNLTRDLYLEEQMQLVSSATNKDIVLDRSYYGELIWPQVYGRESLLDAEGLEVLRELEETVGTVRILMHDLDREAHWQRCVSNNEPLTKSQFVTARRLFYSMADAYGFERKTLHDYPGTSTKEKQETDNIMGDNARIPGETVLAVPSAPQITREQRKLEVANAINDVLSKRILKNKGPIYDELEKNLRGYLNDELAKIFGTTTNNETFTADEIELLKFFCGQLKLKEQGRK